MARHKEPLDGGLWTAPDPGVLESGQLQDARNSLYLAGSRALWRAPGRDAYGVVSAIATAVVGLRDVQFDNSDQYLIALAGSTLKYSAIGDTGTFTTFTTLAQPGSQLESAHFRNRFYLFNGASANASGLSSDTVVYLSATAASSAPQVRQHGMLAVNTAPVSASAAATFSQTVTGYYEYWTTEVAKLTQDGADFTMESTFVGDPATVFVSATTYAPVIARPQIRNPGVTTHWRVYRSPKKDNPKERMFPAGFMVAEVATATANVTDTSTASVSTYAFPTTFPAGNFTGATALGADDGTVATYLTISTPPYLPDGEQLCSGFSFGSISGPILGIEVELQGFVSVSPITVGVTLQPSRGGVNAGKSCVITGTSSGTQNTIVLGSPTDNWASPFYSQWLDTDFNSSFVLRIRVNDPPNAKTLSLDYVKIRVYFGATVETSVQFPTVVYTFGDIVSQVGKNGAPPASTVGDVYEDQLVVNDVSNRSLIRFSYPGEPDAFPETYFIDMETQENDRVRAIKVVNDRLVVWEDSSTWRVNYLPSERDASFDRGKAKAPISSTYGCIDPMCVAVFSPGGGQDVAAYVSHHGIHGTDGYSFDSYTEGLDWNRILRPGSSAPIALINDRSRSLLLFYFQNTADYGSETFMCLALAYGEGHWSGKPKVCGLTHMRNHSGGVFASLESAWAAQRQNGKVSVYLGYGGADTSVGAGKVYIETGTTMPSLDPRLQYTTREMYLADYSNEWEAGEIYGYAHGYDSTPSLSYSFSTRKTNDTAAQSRGSKSITLGGQKLHRAGTPRIMCESLSINMVATASAYAQEFLVIDGEGWGEESAGRS